MCVYVQHNSLMNLIRYKKSNSETLSSLHLSNIKAVIEEKTALISIRELNMLSITAPGEFSQD